MKDLQDHCIVVTGAGGGLGASFARACARAGAQVVVNDLDGDAAHAVVSDIRSEGGISIAHVADVSDAAAAAKLMQRCVSEYGRLTGLVNNAAVSVNAPMELSSVGDLRRMLEVNVVGVYNCARAAVGSMLSQGRGSIVNITSGAHAGHPGLTAYGATKGAVASFTYGWSRELSARGVRVNAVSPMASTQMAAFASHLPAPEANDGAVLFLLSERSLQITGQVLRIVGRRLSLMSHPANIAPVLHSDDWTLERVGRAFDEELAARQVPVGVATYEIASVEPELP